jgi:CheY-like chemotaxis protein
MSTQLLKRPTEVLMVEDNPGDVLLTREAFKDSVSPPRLSVVGDGEEAIAFLRRKGKYGDAPRPDLVLLDLNLPKKSGREVLEEIKADPDLRRIPVIVLTSSAADKDILQCYDLQANSFITKPVDLSQFEAVVEAMRAFWLDHARLPRES